MQSKWRILTLVVVALAVCAGKARSEIATIRIEGEVSYVHPYSTWLSDNFNIGDVVEGWYKYDTVAFDTNRLVTVGSYDYSTAPYGISLTVGEADIVFETDPQNVDFSLKIFNDFPEDRYYIVSNNNLPVSGVTVGLICWQLDDWSGSIFSNTAIPTEAPPILGDWDFRRLDVLMGSRGEPGLGITVTRATTSIPEPATLIFIGLGGLFALRHRQG